MIGALRGNGEFVMCDGFTKAGKRCRRRGTPFCSVHEPAVGGPNRRALMVLIDCRDDVPAWATTLAAMLADELDRQVVVGDGLNAALVGRYVEVLGVLTVDDDGDADPIGDLLAQILDSAPPGAVDAG